MSGDSGYFKLGLFVILGVAMIVAGIVVFGAGALFTDYVHLMTATTESVDGLDVGAAVKYSGVTIGKVAKIELAWWRYPGASPEKLQELRKYIIIDMEIRRDMLVAKDADRIRANLEDAVKGGLRVTQSSSGLTGPTFLEVSFLNPKENPIPELPFAPTGLYLPSAPSTLSRVVSTVEDILINLREANLGGAISDVRKLINNTDSAVSDLQVRDITTRVRQIIDNPKIDQAINDLAAAIASGKQTIESEQIKTFIDDLPKISGRLRDTTNQIDELVRDPKVRQTLNEINATAASAAPAAAEARRVLRRIDQLLASQQQQVESIMTNLRRILENGEALTEDAKANPSRIIFGEPPPHINPGDRK